MIIKLKSGIILISVIMISLVGCDGGGGSGSESTGPVTFETASMPGDKVTVTLFILPHSG